MTKQEEEEFKLSRIAGVTSEMIDILMPFLKESSGKGSGGIEGRIAGDFLERIMANAIAASRIIPEYETIPALYIPLAQIYRSMLYESIIVFWLYQKPAVFDDRFKQLNGDYIKKISALYKPRLTDAELQLLWGKWQKTSSKNFITNPDNTLSPAKCDRLVFSDILAVVAQEVPTTNGMATAYTFLSQQAHVSGFSKNAVDTHAVGVPIFDSTTRMTLEVVALLLSKMPNSQKAYLDISKLADKIKNVTPTSVPRK